METTNFSPRWSLMTLLGVLITLLLASCRFCPRPGDACDLALSTPGTFNELTDSQQSVVFEQQGTIIVLHGSACARSSSSNQSFLRVEQSLDLPAYASNATVFLNGWRMRYLNGDHNVAGLETSINNIRLEGNTLKWQASGTLADDGFDKAINWCYHFTVLAWNPANLNLVVNQEDGTCDPNDHRDSNFFVASNTGTTSSLSTFSSFLKDSNFAGSKSVAILPRGFGFMWDCFEDHNLFQLAYNLDLSEIFLENGKKYKKRFEEVIPPLPNSVSQVDSGFVSWQTSAIFNDDTTRRDYRFGEIVSGLAGADLAIIQPPFSILPDEGPGLFSACVHGPSGVQTHEFVIDNIPYEFAIPMLTGWELNYGCSNDNNVAEIGASIDEFHYRDPSDPPGRLRYTVSSVLRDDNDPGFGFRHKVTILGLRFLGNGTPNQRVPDLVPFSPSGKSSDAFCRLEQGGTILRVTVKNQGNDGAGASKTSVSFGNTSLTLDTPPVPAGGSVDLLFKVPANCFQPDCSFRITVDSTNQINEGSGEVNNSASGGCIG